MYSGQSSCIEKTKISLPYVMHAFVWRKKKTHEVAKYHCMGGYLTSMLNFAFCKNIRLIGRMRSAAFRQLQLLLETFMQ